MIYNVVLISHVQQNDSDTHTHTCTHVYYLDSFSYSYCIILGRAPCAIQWSLLVINVLFIKIFFYLFDCFGSPFRHGESLVLARGILVPRPGIRLTVAWILDSSLLGPRTLVLWLRLHPVSFLPFPCGLQLSPAVVWGGI